MALPKSLADELHKKRARPELKVMTPPLNNGDQLTREEFERRYHAMPQLKKAELIEGIVYMPSPVHFEAHGEPHIFFTTWAGVYLASTPGVRAGDNVTVRMDEHNEPQPDVLLFLDTSVGGKTRISKDDYVEGAPELMVEVAASSASYDLHIKLPVYQRRRVREYIVWRVYDEELDWFELKGGKYVRLRPDPKGVIRSRVFPGLWLDGRALLKGDLARVLAVLQQGLASPEHAAFVKRLAKKATSKKA